MPTKSKHWEMAAFLLTAVALILACSVSTTGPTAAPVFDATKAVLELQATFASQRLTEAPTQAPPAQATAVAPTNPPPAPPTAAAPGPTEVPPVPTVDVEAKIKAAKVLVYENTDERGIGMWVQDALEGLGMKYTQTGSYSGHFMEYLDSGIKWDLIIVDAEDKDKISGEFWDVIYNRLSRDKAALIAEVWYLDRESAGPISKILGGCGVSYRKDLPVDDSVYWWTPDNEVFNEPNTVLPLIHYNLFWANQAGDKLNLGGNGQATMLAGLSARPSTGEGVLASCYDGRVIIQTFSDHDYRQADIIPLWQNYIHYTLKNHFAVMP